MHWYFKVFREYFNFSGRARRKEYWMFALFNMLAALLFLFLDYIVIGTMGFGDISPFYLLYLVISLIPGIAVSVRRLHDIGKSGWWTLIGLIPLIGTIILIVFFCTEGNVGINEFGSDPKLFSQT